MTSKTLKDKKEQLIEELISQVKPSEILSKDGLFSQLKKQLQEFRV